MDTAKKIRRYMERRKLSQDRFARACNLSQSAVSRYITGDRVPDYGARVRIYKGTEGELDLLRVDK